MATTRFQLLSRPGCHLCSEMEQLLDEVLSAHGESYSVENVDAKPEWRSRFGEVIPVLLRDGAPVAKIRVDRRRLERIVRGRRFGLG
jgi:hypothetical protein